MVAANVDPITTFTDGSQLLVSTQQSDEGRFVCDLYTARRGHDSGYMFQVVSNHMEASTCLEAQEIAYSYAQHLYPGTAPGMKKPPYLIWKGPAPHT